MLLKIKFALIDGGGEKFRTKEQYFFVIFLQKLSLLGFLQ